MVKILIAEDNESGYELMRAILKNYNIEWAKNGEEAVRLASTNEYDIIFMDLLMPIVDGLEATKRIRQNNPVIPIIAMTANIYNQDELSAMDSGCTRYVTKPIRKSDILQIIADLHLS